MQVENAALGKATEQRLPHEGRINARELREPQRLRHGVDGLGDDQLVGQLRDLTSASGTKMRDALADGLQDRQRPLKVRLRAAGHDGKITRFGADLPTRHRRVHPVYARGELLRRRHAGRAEVDDHSVLAHARQKPAFAEHQLLDHGGRRQVDADHAIANLPRQLRQ